MKQWKELFQQEEQKEYYRKLMQFLDEEYAHRTIYPPREDLFTCFTSCPFEAVKVVILGQDPYHQPDQAHGLCFSVRKGVQIPRSLKNIYKELKSDMNIDAPSHGCLTDWTKQGIVFVLWGSHAQKKAELITGRQHRILMSAHPSPLSASRGFFGSRPFSTVNRYLEEMGRTPIDWRLSE